MQISVLLCFVQMKHAISQMFVIMHIFKFANINVAVFGADEACHVPEEKS